MSQTLWSKTTLAQAVGLTVAGTTAIAAQAEVSPSITLTSYSLNLRSDDFGAYFTNDAKLEEDSAYAVKLTAPHGADRDLALNFSRLKADDTSRTKFFNNVNAKADYQVADFEAGFHNTLGNTKTRLSAGLRYVDLDQDTSQNFRYNTSPYTSYAGTKYSAKNDVQALGVHIGAEGNMPLGSGFSVSGGAGASFLFGVRESDYHAKYAAGNESHEDEETFYGVDTEIALNYDLSPQTEGGTTISAGFTASYMHDLLQTNYIAVNGLGQNGESDLTTQGLVCSPQQHFLTEALVTKKRGHRLPFFFTHNLPANTQNAPSVPDGSQQLS